MVASSSGATSTAGIGVAQGDDLVVAPHTGGLRLELVGPDHDHGDAPGVGGPVGPLDPLGIGDQEREARIPDGVVDLGLGPPGVERDRHRPDREDGRERDDPFGEVPHGDAHPVPLADPEGVDQGVGQGVDVDHGLVEGPPLVLVDEERRLVAPGPGEHLAEGGGAFLNIRYADPADRRLDQLEELAGPGDLGGGLVVPERHRRTSLPGSSGPIPPTPA